MHEHHRPQLTALSVCSGIGGLDLGVSRAFGARALAYIEREAFAQACLLARMEEEALGPAPVFFDVEGFDGRPFRGLVDIVIGGIPCQPYSVAGVLKRQADERDLVDEFLRIVGEVEPRFAAVENVRGFLAGYGLGRLLGGLSDLGFDAEWEAVSAAQVGAPHKRDRVFVLAYRPGSGIGAPGPCQEGPHGPCGPCGGRDGLGAPELESAGQRRLRGGAGVWPPAPEGDWTRVPEWLWPASQPRLHGVAPRLSTELDLAHRHRVDRLRALGNACIPAQAEAAFRGLLQRVDIHHTDQERE